MAESSFVEAWDNTERKLAAPAHRRCAIPPRYRIRSTLGPEFDPRGRICRICIYPLKGAATEPNAEPAAAIVTADRSRPPRRAPPQRSPRIVLIERGDALITVHQRCASGEEIIRLVRDSAIRRSDRCGNCGRPLR